MVAHHLTNVSSDFRPDVEGLRAIAIVLVLLFHAGVPGFPGGFLGVDVFFVLSGYLITRSLLHEAERSGSIRLSHFFARRVRRLLPASILVIVVTGVGIRWLLPVTSWREFGGDVVASAFYVINWRLAARSVDYLAEGVSASPLQHYWSLAVEEQFYLIWPLLMLIALRIKRGADIRLRVALGILLLGVVFLPSLGWSIFQTSVEPERAFFATTTRLWELSLGAFVALLGGNALSFRPRVASTMRVIGVSAIVLSAITVGPAAEWPGYLALIPTLGTAAVILAGSAPGTLDLADRFLRTAPMQRIGAWSYSLYLWHWPPLALLAAAGIKLAVWQSVLISLGMFIPALVSFYLIENPIRYYHSLVGSPSMSLSVGANLTLAGAGVGAYLLVVSMMVPSGTANTGPVGGSADSSSRPIGALALTPPTTNDQLLEALRNTVDVVPSPVLATQDLPQIYADDCQAPFSATEPIVCSYGAEESSIEVALVGDSKAAQYTDPLIEIAESNNWHFSTYTKSACELSTAMPSREEEPYIECREWSQILLEQLVTDPPDLVLVSQSSSVAWTESSAEDGYELMVRGMHDAYSRLTRAGSEVVMLIDNPHPGMEVYECVAESDDLADCVFMRDDRIATGGRRAQLAVADRYGYPTIDLLDYICPTDMCMPVIGNVLVYRQGSHLTATYVKTLQPILDERLEPFVVNMR